MGTGTGVVGLALVAPVTLAGGWSNLVLALSRQHEAQLERHLGSRLADAQRQAQLALGRAYRKLRQHAKAISTLEPVVRRCNHKRSSSERRSD